MTSFISQETFPSASFVTLEALPVTWKTLPVSLKSLPVAQEPLSVTPESLLVAFCVFCDFFSSIMPLLQQSPCWKIMEHGEPSAATGCVALQLVCSRSDGIYQIKDVGI